MASSKVLESVKLQIEVEVNMDKDGNPIYSKKSISNCVRGNAEVENICIVAAAISDILAKDTGEMYLNETHVLRHN